MLLAVLSCFLFAALMPLMGRYLVRRAAAAIALLPLAIFVWAAFAGTQVQQFQYPWLPALGIELSFTLDGLSRLFVLLISGVGTLVFLYSSEYLKGHPYLDRFYGYLSLFMGAMLGLVLSENLVSLFVFWELTSISSFFLIGFNNEQADSRKSAITALTLTGLGGLSLLAAAVLIYTATDSFSIQELLNSTEPLGNHALYLPIVLLIFGAAFTKSAQFPFHFGYQAP
jgi:multicomponent Na+:H+ antiporter subunit A